MSDVAIKEDVTPTMGQSPFAIARGQAFEKSLFKENGSSLVKELTRKGVLPKNPIEFHDFRLRLNGGQFHTLDESRSATSALLRHVADGAAGTLPPILVAGATISVPGGVMLPEAILVIDALVIRADLEPPQLVVGEIKTYPDRGGYTDRAELASARAQAGVYVHGLRIVIDQELHLADALQVADEGFLVLSRPGFNNPTVRAGEDLRYQAERAGRGFEGLHEVADGHDPDLADADADTKVGAVLKADTAYEQRCWTFCDRAPVCQEKALAAGNPAVLGDDAARFLGSVSLARAIELLGGAIPEGAAEQDLMRRIRACQHQGGRR
jgi:hypothetical protein